jgi:inosine triphosphate pyrophosphatase
MSFLTILPMTMQIYYVTSNQTKFDEACHIFYENDEDKRLFEIVHSPLHLDEIQGSCREIAKHKAFEAFSKLNKPVIIDDVSVHCPALGGLPGPYVKAFLAALGEHGLYELISHYEDKSCYATCTIAFLEEQKTEPMIFEGSWKAILVPPRGETRHGNLSWNAIVQPEGFTKTFAELTLKEISLISARGKALRLLKTYLQERHHERS